MKRKTRKPIVHFDSGSYKVGPAVWNQLVARYELLLAAQDDPDRETYEQLV